MLTETSAAPTITLTPIITPTLTQIPTETLPPVGSKEQPVPVGKFTTADGAGLIVLSVNSPASVGKLKTANDSTFLNADVIIENDSNKPMDYTPLYFHLLDSGKIEYQPQNNAAWPALQSGTLQPGEWVRGNVTFTIPADRSGLLLNYSPQTASNTTVGAWVDLSLPALTPEKPETGPVATVESLPGRGQRVEKDGIALTVGQISASQRIEQTQAAKENMMIALVVTIENTARPKTPYNPEYFKVKDNHGYEYPAVIIPAETMLQPGSLAQGQKVSGSIAFEVPANLTMLVVEYQPQVLVENYPEIRIQSKVPAAK